MNPCATAGSAYLVLDVLWQDDDGRRVVCFRDPYATVQEMAYLGWRRGLLDEACDVREHSVQVEFLLIAGAANGRLGLAADRQNRSMIQLAVVQARDQVGCSGAARGKAPSQFVGELGVCNRHEGGHFFVPNLDELDFAGPLERADHAVDAVTRITVDAANAPSVQPSTTKSPTFISRLRTGGKRCVLLDQTLLLELGPEIGRDLGLKRVPVFLDLPATSRSDDQSNRDVRRR